MVFYFTAENGWLMYMGKDKHENEDLIKHSWPEDVWFHVDKLSSAHVYLRLPLEYDWETIPEEVVKECCVLVKANSIEGCKKSAVDVVYTPASNLKKTADMEIGQVGFKSRKPVKRLLNVEKDRETEKRHEKNKEEKHPDLAQEKQERDNEVRRRNKELARQQKKAKEEEARRFAEEKEARSYDRIMDSGSMTSNRDINPDTYEEDFM